MGPAESARWRSLLLGPGGVLVLLLAVELLAHGLARGSNDPFVITLFLLALAPIAYSGLRGGLPLGLVSATMLTLYTPHFTAPHAAWYALDAAAARSTLIVAAIALGMAWTMSRLKRHEDQMRAALHARATELERRNRELTESNAALEAFGYVVSHDLKEPVRALENYLDAALQEWPQEASREHVARAYEANQRLSRMLHGLLDYSRTSSAAAASRPVDVADVVEGETCRARYGALLRERDGELRVERPIPPVRADEVLLAQLLGNLVLNAVKHNPAPRPRVVVRGEALADGRVRVVVADDGKGFPPEVLQRYERLKDRPATIKSGFGLVIARRAADRLQGRLALVNGAQGGEAHVELPAA